MISAQKPLNDALMDDLLYGLSKAVRVCTGDRKTKATHVLLGRLRQFF
jgi:hypothetical protein